MTQLETVPRSIRLKSSGPTFSGTDSVCQKTCVTRVDITACVSHKRVYDIFERWRQKIVRVPDGSIDRVVGSAARTHLLAERVMLDQVFGWLDNSIGVTSPRAAQYLEFRALRTGYITGLALAGVTPTMPQERARRSDNNLKLGKYTRVERNADVDQTAPRQSPSRP